MKKENEPKKKGISAVVAIVLMILISVAGMGILYEGVMPLFGTTEFQSSENSISIDTEGGYTLYDETQGIACVQVKRGSSAEIDGLKVLFAVEGNSHSSIVSKEDLPAVNEKRTYCFDLSSFGKPDTVTVVTLPEGIPVTSLVPIRAISINALGSIQSSLRDLDNDDEDEDGGAENIELVSNGDFSANPDDDGSWIIEGYTWSGTADWWWSNARQYAILGPQYNWGTTFYQDVDTKDGTIYRVMFKVPYLVIMPFDLGGAGSFKATFDGTDIEITSEGTYNQDIVSDGNGRITFNFSNPTLGVDGAWVDNVSIKEV